MLIYAPTWHMMRKKFMYTLSIHNIPIRLTDERWQHIISQHVEMSDHRQSILEAVRQPDCIVQGNDGEMIAVVETEPHKWLLVVYREWDTDGFIITAFFTSRKNSFARKKVIWSP